MILEILVAISIIALAMLIWFNSDAFLIYGKLFGIHKFLKYDEYQEERLMSPWISYPIFLKMKYDYFIFKLIGCKLCLSVWLSGIMAFYFSVGIITWIGWTAFLSIFSLFIYGHISKLLNENK